jgi:hypothetical protein
MTRSSEDDIVNRAYEIWERKGRPEDRATEFLTLAHEELRSGSKTTRCNRSIRSDG